MTSPFGTLSRGAQASVSLRYAATYGGAVALLTAAAAVGLGWASQAPHAELLQAMLPAAQRLCVASMTMAATTLALMLTLLGLSARINARLADAHYRSIRRVAQLDVIAFALAVAFLLVLAIPFSESNAMSDDGVAVLYYANIAVASILGGLVVAVVVMIYRVLCTMVEVFISEDESPIVVGDD